MEAAVSQKVYSTCRILTVNNGSIFAIMFLKLYLWKSKVVIPLHVNFGGKVDR